MVITLDKNKKPLGTCTERRARKLMENGRACVYRYFPFTIIIKDRDVRQIENLPEYRIKIDPGAKHTGIAVVREDTGEFVFGMQIEHHAGEIVSNLKKRRDARRNRRQRETRYRKPKWGNKKLKKGRKPQYDSSRQEGWLPPSVRSIAEGIISWVNRLMRLFNITACSFEANRFDTQLMDNPDIEGEQYQHGTLFGYEIREYLLHRYGHTCQYCGGASKDPVLEWEHVVPKSQGGSDKVSNATLACHTCNQDKGSKSLDVWLAEEKKTASGKGRKARRELAEARAIGIQKVAAGQVNGVSDRYCAWANNLRKAVEKELFSIFGEVECSSGGRTKANRTALGLPKAHHYDALCVGVVPQEGFVDRTNGYFLIAECVGRGTRYRSKHNAIGLITVKPKGKVPKRRFGFQNGDIVRANVPAGYKYQGIYTGRVMTRASGWFSIRTLGGKLVEAKVEFCRRLQPDNGYKYTVARV